MSLTQLESRLDNKRVFSLNGRVLVRSQRAAVATVVTAKRRFAASWSARPAGTRTVPPWAQGLLAFATYLVTFVIAAGLPLARHLNVPNLRQYWTDVQFYAWSLGWWPYAVSHGTNPLFSDQIGAPHGYDLAWASTAPVGGPG